MVKFVEIFRELVIKTLERAYQFIVEVAPKVVLAAIILLVGWLCAILLKKIVTKLLKALGFDVISEKTGLRRFLERGGIKRSPSSVIGLCFYWLLIFSALIMVFNALELEAASRLVQEAVFYLPKVVVAIVCLAIGIFISQFVGKFVQTSSHLANIPMYGLLGRAARYVVIGLTLMVALEYLGVGTSIIVEYAVIIFGVVPLVLCLIFLVGGRDIVASILAGRLLLKEYKKGQRIEFDSISGEIESIDVITTKIKDNEEVIIIPNSELAKKIIKRKI